MRDRALELEIILISVTACLLMIFIETELQPSYGLKSAVKIGLFAGAILFSAKWFGVKPPLCRPDKSCLKKCAVIAAAVFTVILTAYFLCGWLIDFEQIRAALMEKEHIQRENFIFAALYISICNSFIEEIFFRGFVFLGLYGLGYRRTAYLYSAAAFAVYHIGIISAWFSWYLYLAALAALFFAGILLDFFAKRGNSFLCSWLIHICANLGINAIGFMIL